MARGAIKPTMWLKMQQVSREGEERGGLDICDVPWQQTQQLLVQLSTTTGMQEGHMCASLRQKSGEAGSRSLLWPSWSWHGAYDEISGSRYESEGSEQKKHMVLWQVC